MLSYLVASMCAVIADLYVQARVARRAAWATSRKVIYIYYKEVSPAGSAHLAVWHDGGFTCHALLKETHAIALVSRNGLPFESSSARPLFAPVAKKGWPGRFWMSIQWGGYIILHKLYWLMNVFV